MRKVEDLKNISDFTRSILTADPRIRFRSLVEHDNYKFFYVTKEYIHIPCDLPAVEHEIAHAVEMKNKDRWLLPDWGLSFGNKWENKLTPGKMFAAMAREIRVRAIQLRMMPEEFNNSHSTALNILNNPAWNDWAKMMTPFGRFKSYGDVRDWSNDLRDRTYNAWSIDRIAHEWKIRLIHMQEYMETKEDKSYCLIS